MDSRQEITAIANDEASQPIEIAQSAGLIARLGALHGKGSASLTNLSIYAFGVSGLWTALGTPLLPARVGEIVEAPLARHLQGVAPGKAFQILLPSTLEVLLAPCLVRPIEQNDLVEAANAPDCRIDARVVVRRKAEEARPCVVQPR